jgi:hypothetical protein
MSESNEYGECPVCSNAAKLDVMTSRLEWEESVVAKLDEAFARAKAAETDRTDLVDILRELLVNPAYPGTYGWSYFECMYCLAGHRDYGNKQEDLNDVDVHTPDCPWRRAKEWVENNGAR